MPQSLFDISEDMIALDDLLVESGGDISDPKTAEAVEVWMKELASKFKEKADGYAALISMMFARAAMRKEEADRLARRAKVDTSAAKFLSDRLKKVMESQGIKKLETTRFRISVAGNGGLQPMNIYDDSLIPRTFFVPQPDALDAEKLRAALKAGEQVPGVAMLERGTHLSIR
jgi:hypothetical protein